MTASGEDRAQLGDEARPPSSASQLSELEARLHFLEESQKVSHFGSFRAHVGPESLLELSTESYRIMGFEPGSAVRNLDFFNLLHPEDREDLLEAFIRARTEFVRSEIDVRIVRRDGLERNVQVIAVPLPDKVTVTGTIQDVTERRRAEDPEAQRRLTLERELRRALAEEQLYLEFQPIISLSPEPDHGHFIGVEALVRWLHPERGKLEPDEFVSLAEETGLIVPLGAYVLRAACRELRRWIDAGIGADVTMSINVSPPQLRSDGFVASLSEAIEAAGISGTSLVLEITESMLVEGALDEAALRAIRTLGARIAIDDFGTKYSALSYLTRLSIDALKIDESFVRNVEDAAGRAVVVAITALGGALGLHVTAEGVQTEAQERVLREIGCDAVQGFLIAPPLSGGECLALLLKDHRS